ncbi:MAG: ADP-ribosylglycohydrolase family protein [Lachnospiraceae bacterium]|nr:ADP-ribosylglycohydrolase family protein [Lachnospiraceae bacterium]
MGLENENLEKELTALHEWEVYASQLLIEYEQSMDEGLDIEAYKEVFEAISKMPLDNKKDQMADVLFQILQNAKIREEYPYREPSTLEEIKALRKAHIFQTKEPGRRELEDKIYGAWMGRVCGCLLGKPVEGIRTKELHPLLKASDNFPMHRYIVSGDITKEMYANYEFDLKDKCFADTVDGMPVDDDTNYVVLAQKIVEDCGREFTSADVAKAWLAYQPKDAYCTAERVAFCNFVKGYQPPVSAIYKNPYREWIGAQIRGDYFGYINPGNPEKAAEMAFRDAAISHIKNGIYGEMFAAAMIACGAVTDSIEDIVKGGLAQIPASSRLYEAVTDVLNGYDAGVSREACFAGIHKRFDEHTAHGWCHTISNAMIVAAALLYGEGDFGKSICMAVETGFDTDCNGATVGSVLGMRNGIAGIGQEWLGPVNDKLHTSIFGVGTVSVKEMAEKTMAHLVQ